MLVVAITVFVDTFRQLQTEDMIEELYNKVPLEVMHLNCEAAVRFLTGAWVTKVVNVVATAASVSVEYKVEVMVEVSKSVLVVEVVVEVVADRVEKTVEVTVDVMTWVAVAATLARFVEAEGVKVTVTTGILMYELQ